MEDTFLPDQILSLDVYAYYRLGVLGVEGTTQILNAAIEYCEKARGNYEVLGATLVVAEVKLYLAQIKSQYYGGKY